MLNIKFVKQNPEIAKQSQKFRGKNEDDIDKLLLLDDKRKKSVNNLENLRAKQNELGKKIPQAKDDEKQKLLKELKALSDNIEVAKKESDTIINEFNAAAFAIDNIIEGAPQGGEDDYIVIDHFGKIRDFEKEGIKIKDHLDIGQDLDILDTIRGAKVSGSRFYFLKGLGAQLELALERLAIDTAIEEGLTLAITPTLVLPEVMEGTGFLGEHSAEVYRLTEPDNLYLVGTSEVALAGLHKDEILDLSKGSKSYAGVSTCYRREAGSYGKDTRGIIRVHQFNKIEMFTYSAVENAESEHERILSIEKKLLDRMEIPYRVIDIAAGDLGSSAARKFDCEAFLPSQNRYLELTSTSNCTTYQARRLNIRYTDAAGKKQICATQNGTLATTRWLVAILENHQQADGSVKLPKALSKYMGNIEYIR
ncbi:MAG: serine--tRNA ligase [Bifidobacteriaceae bacterium]|jgi:seryl-tRNA synthetase|nr:serine--tRNA ligase [Bifidobacteriaceae bacterium]